MKPSIIAAMTTLFLLSCDNSTLSPEPPEDILIVLPKDLTGQAVDSDSDSDSFIEDLAPELLDSAGDASVVDLQDTNPDLTDVVPDIPPDVPPDIPPDIPPDTPPDVPPAEICDDGVDNDGDGLTDCEDDDDCFGPPACPEDFGAALGDFELVFYWMAFEADHPGPPEVALEADDGAILAVVSQGFADTLVMEGTGELLDGRILNLENECPGAPTGWCYFEVDVEVAPYGKGSAGPLAPFRSVAMDEANGLAGQVLYAPALDGLPLPADEFIGPVHDGCLLVSDTGWALGADQVDLYVYLQAHHVPLDAAVDTDAFALFTDSPQCPPDGAL